MTNRDELRQNFLISAGWAGASLANLAGDASNRRYFRLEKREEGAKAVLMDAPPEKGEDVRPFVAIAAWLRSAGLSAPEIYAEDSTQGFLLLEDLGDDLFARVVTKRPELEVELYQAATEALITLRDHPLPSGLERYSAALMTELAALSFDWYQSGILGDTDQEAKQRFMTLFQRTLGEVSDGSDVLIQRDYHAENLIWMPERDGVKRVGLLDFQDAMAGHAAYDLVSLLQDARRDVSAGIERAMIDHYVARTGLDPDTFRRAYVLLGVQRNLRILGVFARLCIRDGKSHYVDLIPRVWRHLMADLKNSNLAELETIICQALPAPTAENLDILKSKCATPQMP